MAPPLDQDAIRKRYIEERDKRLRKDSTEQFIEPTGVFKDYDKDPYTKPFERAPIKEDADVGIIGAGYGGMMAGVYLQRLGVTSYKMIDKAGDIGGTWYWNRYPNAQCDVEGAIYMPFLEESGLVPTEKYSHGPELLEHARTVGRKFDLYKNAILSTEVTEIRWDDATTRYTIRTNRGDELRVRFLIVATGLLARIKLPGVPGIDKFKGEAFHTSRWNYEYTGGDSSGNLHKLRDKNVAIIGTGATAVQAFQRTPSAVDYRHNKPVDPEWFRSLPKGWQQARKDNFTAIIGGMLPEKDEVADGWTDLFKTVIESMAKGAEGADVAQLMQLADDLKMQEIRDRVDQVVKDKDTAKALKPWYARWCKRPCFHDEYLEAFNKPNVTLVDTAGKGVERFTEDAVWANGKEYKVDLVIYATGFEWATSNEFSHRNGFEIYGRNGVALSRHWQNGRTRTLHGIHTNGFPNFYCVQLAQSGVTINFPHALEEIVKHIAFTINECIKRNIRELEATEEAVDGYTKMCLEMAKGKTAFLESCTPGYYNSEGRASSDLVLHNEAYGGGPLVYWNMLREWREEGSLKGMVATPFEGNEQQARL